MKAFYGLILLVFLASCTPSAPEATQEVVTPSTEQSGEASLPESDDMDEEESEAEDEDMEDDMTEIEAEVNEEMEDDIAELDETAANEIMNLDASYTNPKGPVDMVVNVSVDEDDVIQSLEVTATTYDVTDFNAAAQELVGQNISEAEDFYVAGGSLTSDAFTMAIKNR